MALANGQSRTCEITNNDQPAQLTIIKRIVNDNGGSATVGAFNITTSAGALTFGAAVQNPTNQFNYTSQTLTVNAGTFTLIESDVTGYSEGAWSCTGTGAAGTPNPTRFAPGGHVTCEIANNDIAPSSDKNVTNDNGGSATASTWTLRAGAAPPTPVQRRSGSPAHGRDGYIRAPVPVGLTGTFSELGGRQRPVAHLWYGTTTSPPS